MHRPQTVLCSAVIQLSPRLTQTARLGCEGGGGGGVIKGCSHGRASKVDAGWLIRHAQRCASSVLHEKVYSVSVQCVCLSVTLYVWCGPVSLQVHHRHALKCLFAKHILRSV